MQSKLEIISEIIFHQYLSVNPAVMHHMNHNVSYINIR
jgi:hypothetical protein